ncbi:MAG: tRNA (cytidine(34)-2'-O)-methyltransferase [Syntrophobacteraceae bacterium]
MPITSSGRSATDGSPGGNAAPRPGRTETAEGAPAPLRVVLYQPEIPQNTGNVARTCAATHTPLHLVEPLGFRITDRHLKRAGLDYWPYVDLKVHKDLDALHRELSCCRWICFSSRARLSYYDFSFMPGDCLLFGPETTGLPAELLESMPERVLQIPLDKNRVRCLNLATTVGIALFEALRQLNLCNRTFA